MNSKGTPGVFIVPYTSRVIELHYKTAVQRTLKGSRIRTPPFTFGFLSSSRSILIPYIKISGLFEKKKNVKYCATTIRFFILCPPYYYLPSAGSAIWQYGLWSFQRGVTKLVRFLPKNQHPQRKLLNFENWISGGLRSFQISDFKKSIIFFLPFT